MSGEGSNGMRGGEVHGVWEGVGKELEGSRRWEEECEERGCVREEGKGVRRGET